MIPAVPSRHRGARTFILLLLILLAAADLVTTPAASARQDMQISTQGDPGDGTLSPEADAIASGGDASSSLTTSASADTRTWILVPDLWLAPVAVVPWPICLDVVVILRAAEAKVRGVDLGPAVPPRNPRARADVAILSPVRKRGCHNAR